jgi:hypothetical protein
MLQHRMAVEADPARDLGAFLARLHAGEGDAGARNELLDALQPPEEIEMPPRAAELAVGDGLQPRLLLLPDHALDLAVLDRLQRRGSDLALRALLARLLQRLRTEQAPDMVCPEGRSGALHRLAP